MKIAIVDDRNEDRTRLEKCIRRFFSLQNNDNAEIDTFASAKEFLPAFSRTEYQIAFLDIVMDEMNGIELAKKLREKDAHLLIVFQTTSREYAFDAFPVHPFDYLMKPCEQEDLDNVLAEAQRVLKIGDSEIKVASARDSFSVPLRSICAVVARGHNVEIMLANMKTLVCTETFKSISQKIESDPRFLLINRGVIINMDQVRAPEDGGMRMKNGSIFPIKINGRAAVLSSFSQYMISSVDRRPL